MYGFTKSTPELCQMVRYCGTHAQLERKYASGFDGAAVWHFRVKQHPTFVGSIIKGKLVKPEKAKK